MDENGDNNLPVGPHFPLNADAPAAADADDAPDAPAPDANAFGADAPDPAAPVADALGVDDPDAAAPNAPAPNAAAPVADALGVDDPDAAAPNVPAPNAAAPDAAAPIAPAPNAPAAAAPNAAAPDAPAVPVGGGPRADVGININLAGADGEDPAPAVAQLWEHLTAASHADRLAEAALVAAGFKFEIMTDEIKRAYSEHHLSRIDRLDEALADINGMLARPSKYEKQVFYSEELPDFIIPLKNELAQRQKRRAAEIARLIVERAAIPDFAKDVAKNTKLVIEALEKLLAELTKGRKEITKEVYNPAWRFFLADRVTTCCTHVSSRIATRAIFGSLEVGALFVALVAVFNAFGPGRDDFTWVFALSLVFAVDQTVLAVSANLRKLVKEGAPVLPWHLWMKAPKRRSFSKSWSRNLFWFTYAGLIIGAVLVGITIWKWPRSHPGAAQAAPPPPPLGTNPPLYTSRTHSPPMPAPGMWEFIFWIGSVARIVWNLNNLMRDLQKDEELH